LGANACFHDANARSFASTSTTDVISPAAANIISETIIGGSFVAHGKAGNSHCQPCHHHEDKKGMAKSLFQDKETFHVFPQGLRGKRITSEYNLK
jgi:hypothetical protein